MNVNPTPSSESKINKNHSNNNSEVIKSCPYSTSVHRSKLRRPSADSLASPAPRWRINRPLSCPKLILTSPPSSLSYRKWFPLPSSRKRLLSPPYKWRKPTQWNFRRQTSRDTWVDNRSSMWNKRRMTCWRKWEEQSPIVECIRRASAWCGQWRRELAVEAWWGESCSWVCTNREALHRNPRLEW